MARQKKPRRWTTEELEELVYSAVGAASVPLWQTHPDDTFPSDDVIRMIKVVLEEHNV